MLIPIIVIPIYKDSLTSDEEASLRQCLNILGKYDICFVTPKKLKFENYQNILNEYNKNFKIERFSDKYFKSLVTYSKLILSTEFYEKFLNYDKMLIYQLDAWVFKDSLEYWCNQPYDYIGAPWFEGFNDSKINPQTPLLKYCGNSGFSLRSVDKMYKLVSTDLRDYLSFKEIFNKFKKKRFISNFINLPKFLIKWIFQKGRFYSFWKINNLYEDYVINKIVQKYYMDWFKLAPADIAMKFSFEVQPEVLFEMNNKELPFGCHAFKKYNWEFFSQYINL